jgi:hypothetical protein
MMASRQKAFGLSIAGLACRFELTGRYELVDEAMERYKGFMYDGPPDLTFLVTPPRDPRPPDSPGRGWARRTPTAIAFGRRDFCAEWSEQSRSAAVTLIDNVYTFDALLRMFFSLFAVSRRGVMLHSAALAREGVGYLFVGRSESGKSTLAKLADGFDHLTDELAIVLPRDDGFVICGTPFWGLFEKGGLNTAVPLGRLFLLVKNGRTFLRDVPARTSVQRLLGCTMNFLVDGDWHEQIMGTLMKLGTETRPTELHCVPDEAVWELLL